LLIYTRNAMQLDQVDRLLWSAPPTGFVPHCRAGHKLAPQTAILLSGDAGFDPASTPDHDVLINLDDALPAHFSRYERLLEIVSAGDQDDRQRARERLRFYRERGYQTSTIDLATLGVKESP
jgi:DNA polymerase-3 subunit chi